MVSEGDSRCDVLVVGAGHAGIEAALAAARLGARVQVVTLRRAGIGQMSCNPAIGGVGKGHLVREIDALGGAMAQVADCTGTQFRRLNTSRGPAVRARRCQSDALLYRQEMGARLQGAPGVQICEDEVVDLQVGGDGIRGVVTARHGSIAARAVVLTAGTFLNGVCHVGAEQAPGGRAGDAPAVALSAALRRLGIALRRFKTGTTPRLAADSIRWSALTRQDGDATAHLFAFDPPPRRAPEQPCFIAYTGADTHAVVRAGLPRSPLYQGIIAGVGPRYCPSLEDKVVRFPTRPRHQVFLEFESAAADRVYPNGLSTSLPRDVQLALLRTIVGLEQVRVLQYGYAVEYDYAPPTQLDLGLMVRHVPGLFMAGQLNGSSGYEEAAAQGLMAGLNAARYCDGAPRVHVGRDQGYIGVLIDDLVTAGMLEPYRMFTARAEYRLTLRESNAEARLAPLAAQWGLLGSERWAAAQQRQAALAALQQRVTAGRVDAATLTRCGWPAHDLGLPWAAALRRPEARLAQLIGPDAPCEPALAEQIEEAHRYGGYIARETQAMARLRAQEAHALPPWLTYRELPGLSRELQERLEAARPETLGQAGRVSGMTPAALALLRLLSRRAAPAEAVPRTAPAPPESAPLLAPEPSEAAPLLAPESPESAPLLAPESPESAPLLAPDPPEAAPRLAPEPPDSARPHVS